ncbi:MAG: DNA primase [Chloroflexi bacterium]|nr:DNA primase [Anaerolineaceae bacterium]NMB91104.1 DNA primase [Chloroflexota bacterium]
MSVIDEIKSRIDVVELISESVKLRRSGKNYTGFCPFHANTRTPAFVVFPDSGTWRCFGQCNEGGDVFRFVMKKEGWDFPQALQYLAQRTGVQLEAPSPQRQAEEEQFERLHALLEDAVTLFQHHLLQNPSGKPALAYLQKRGVLAETIERFGLGYAPDDWDTAVRYFTSKGYSPEELLQAGMASERQSGSGVYDRFRNRIMFPIRDGMGKMAGFGARILNPEDNPKFLNSPQTPLFDKGRLLYALDQARKEIRARDQVVIVEGYLDAIVLHQAGFTNTVSPMGTALTEDHLRMLKRFTRRIVLALDADAAGEKATLRGLEMARQAMDHGAEIAFDPRGLLHHEARLQADLRVTTLPAGEDPDEVVLRDPQEWEQILQAARPVVVHVMETLASGRDLEDPKVKSEIAAQVLPLIEDVPNAVEREAYRQRLARLLRVDERAFVGQAAPPARRPRRRETPGQAAPRPGGMLDITANQRTRELEFHSLRLIIRQPEALYLLDRALQQAGVSRFTPQDFEHADHQVLVRLAQEALAQDEQEPNQYIQAGVPETLTDLFESLRSPIPFGEPNADRLIEDLIRTVLTLRYVRVNESVAQVSQMQEDLQSQGEAKLKPYYELFSQYMQTLSRLDKALRSPLTLD